MNLSLTFNFTTKQPQSCKISAPINTLVNRAATLDETTFLLAALDAKGDLAATDYGLLKKGRLANATTSVYNLEKLKADLTLSVAKYKDDDLQTMLDAYGAAIEW